MTVEFALSKGYVALVDDEDAERVAAVMPWHSSNCDGKVYARHSYVDQFDRPRSIALHTFLTGWSLVDHVNGDGLDNRRENLRPATPSQNNANRRRSSVNSTGFKGVSLYKRTGRFRAYLGIGGTIRHLGYFATADEAARVYDAAAVEVFGEYALLNFPIEAAS
jgi:hypothetical protein